MSRSTQTGSSNAGPFQSITVGRVVNESDGRSYVTVVSRHLPEVCPQTQNAKSGWLFPSADDLR